MQSDKIITIITLLVIAIALWLIFSYTKVTPLTFVLGAIIFLITQFILVCAYCIVKIQQTRWQAHTISLHRNKKLDPQTQYKFEDITPNLQLYLNRFTEQAKLFYQKNQIKPKQTLYMDKFYFQELEIDQPKTEVMNFLQQLQDFDNGLNMFTNVLVSFGKDLIYLEKGSIFSAKKFYFSQFQRSYPSRIPTTDLKDAQINTLRTLNIKFKKYKQDSSLCLPYWQILIEVLKFVGTQYSQIERMRKSNCQLLGMIHRKVLQDFSALQKKLIGIGKQLNTTLKNLDDLKKDYAKYQNSQININAANNQPHLQIMHRFRKQFYTFKDLQRRIKQNQLTFKEKNRQKQYYQGKLSMFRDISRRTYGKPMKTRYLALVDSYSISVDESIHKIGQQFYKDIYVPIEKPQVKDVVISKNLNQALAAEKQYQKQYFKRVQYYENILNGLLKSMASLGQFINSLRNVFFNMIQNLKAAQQRKRLMATYFTNVTKKLLDQTIYIFNELNQLLLVNQKMVSVNQPQLEIIGKQIRENVTKSFKILNQINIDDGPILYKYNSARNQIQAMYKQIQTRISRIQQFQQLYLLHSNRIKKIILVNFIEFLSRQKNIISIGEMNLKLKGMDAKGSDDAKVIQDLFPEALDNPNILEQTLDNENDIKADVLQTGFQLSHTYIKFANRFLFVCYTEWKNSTFFKQLICQQLFIAFNKEPNESFAKIQVSEMQFLGLPPQVVWLKQLKSEQNQAFFDIQLAFRGTIKFKVNTIYKLIREIPVQVGIQMNQFYCVMRFCFVPSDVGMGWFSFIGEPISQFKIIPRIASFSLDFQAFKSMFNNFLLDKLRKNAYPIKKNMLIPASRKDDDLDMIMKRFRMLQENRS